MYFAPTTKLPVLIIDKSILAAHSQPCPQGYQKDASGNCVKAVSVAREIAVESQVNTGLIDAQKAKNFLRENQNEIIQIVGVSVLIALGFAFLEK